jgi:secreted Zn-dependent insulinase-like peptidase
MSKSKKHRKKANGVAGKTNVAAVPNIEDTADLADMPEGDFNIIASGMPICMESHLVDSYEPYEIGVIAIIARLSDRGVREIDELLEEFEKYDDNLVGIADCLMTFQQDKLLLIADYPIDEQAHRLYWFFQKPYSEESLKKLGFGEIDTIPEARFVAAEEAICDFDARFIMYCGRKEEYAKFASWAGIPFDDLYKSLMQRHSSNDAQYNNAWEKIVKEYRAAMLDRRCSHV